MGGSDSHRKDKSSCLDKLRAEHRRYRQEIASIRSCKTSSHFHGKRFSPDIVATKDSPQVSLFSLPRSCLIQRHSHGIEEEWGEGCKCLSPASGIKEQEAIPEQRDTFSHGRITKNDDPSISWIGHSARVSVDVRVSPSECASGKTRDANYEKEYYDSIDAWKSFEPNGKHSMRVTATTLFTANKGQIIVNSTGSSDFTTRKSIQNSFPVARANSTWQHSTCLQLEQSCSGDPSLGETHKIVNCSGKRVLNVPIQSIYAQDVPASSIASVQSSDRENLRLQSRQLDSEDDLVNKHKDYGSSTSRVDELSARKEIIAILPLPSSNQGSDQMLASNSVNKGTVGKPCHHILREPRISAISDKIVEMRQGICDPDKFILDHSSAAQISYSEGLAGSLSRAMEHKVVFPDDKHEPLALPCSSTSSDPDTIRSHLEETQTATMSIDREARELGKPFEDINPIMQPHLAFENAKGHSSLKNALSKRLADQIKNILETLDDNKPINNMPTKSRSSVTESALNHSSKQLLSSCSSISRLGRITSVGMPRLRRQFTMNDSPHEAKENDAEIYLQEVVAALVAKSHKDVFDQHKSENMREDGGTIAPNVPAADHQKYRTLQSHLQNQTLPVEAKRLSDKGEQTDVSAITLWQYGEGIECKTSSTERASAENATYRCDPSATYHVRPEQTNSEHCIRSMADNAFVVQALKVLKEGNLPSETNFIPVELVRRDAGKDNLADSPAGASRMQALWRLASKVVPVTLKDTSPRYLSSVPCSPDANDNSNEKNFACDKFLQDTRKKVQKFIRGCRILENTAVEIAFQPPKEQSPVTTSGAEDHNQIRKVEPKKGLQDSRAVAAESLAHDIQVLMLNKNANHVVSTSKSIKWSNLGDSVAAAAQVVCQLPKDSVPLSTGDKWKNLVMTQEARSAFAKSTVFNMVGGNFDYDQIYQDLRELEEEGVKIHQREKARSRLMSPATSLVGAFIKVDAQGKKNQACEGDRRLRPGHGTTFVSSKSGSSTKRRRNTQSPARETGNKVPRLGSQKIQFQNSRCNDHNAESAKLGTHSEKPPEIGRKFQVDGHAHRHKKISDSISNRIIGNHGSETLGVRITDDAVVTRNVSDINHPSCKKNVKFRGSREKVPAWVERMYVKCKPLQNHCDSGCKNSHEKLYLGSSLRRRSLRPPDAIFRSGKPIDWMPHGMKVLKFEAPKKSSKDFCSLDGSSKLYCHVDELPAKHEHQKCSKKLMDKISQLKKSYLPGKVTKFFVHKDEFENNTISPLHYQKSASIQRIYSGRMPSHFLEGKLAVSSDSESKLSKSSEAPMDALEHQHVHDTRIAPPLDIIGPDKPEYAIKVSQAIPSASICKADGDGGKPRGSMILNDFSATGSGNNSLQKDTYINSSNIALTFLPESSTSITTSNLPLETVTAEKVPLSKFHPVSTCETMHHQGELFDVNAENGIGIIQCKEKLNSLLHSETKDNFGYNSQLEEEVLKRALLEVILHSIVNEDHDQSAKQNQQDPNTLASILKTKSRCSESSQIQKEVCLLPLEDQNQDIFCSATMSDLIDYKTDRKEPLAPLPLMISCSESLHPTISTQLTTCGSHHLHSEAHANSGLTLLPWPILMPQYVMVDERMAVTPIKANLSALSGNSISNSLNMANEELSSGQERELAAFSKEELNPDPAFVSSSPFTQLNCLAEDAKVIAFPIARNYRLGQTTTPTLGLEELQSCPYEVSVNVNSLADTHSQIFFEVVNENLPETNQLIPNEENQSFEEAAVKIEGSSAKSYRSILSPEHAFGEYGFNLKDKAGVEGVQRHATISSEFPTFQSEQRNEFLGIGIKKQTQDFQGETAPKIENSCAAEEPMTEGCEYDIPTIRRSYFHSIKWTKEEHLQLAAWSLIEKFSLSDDSPEQLSGYSFRCDEQFLSEGEADFKELGRVLFPFFSEDSISSSSNRPFDSSSSSSKDFQSSAGTTKTNSDSVRCDLPEDTEGHLSEGEFEPGTVKFSMEEVGQLHQQPYIEPGELKSSTLEGFPMPLFSHEKETSGSISEGEAIPGYLGEKGEIWKKL